MDDRKSPRERRIEIEGDDPDRLPASEQAGDDAAAPNVKPGDEDASQEQTPKAQQDTDDLSAEVERLTELYDAEHDQHLRAVAALQNLKRRAERDLAERLQFANQQLLANLLPIADNLERALAAEDEDASRDDLARGVRLVLEELHRLLHDFGVERIEAEQETFDPSIHEAVAQVETDDAPEGVILEVETPGYRLHHRVLRPARVIVAKRPSEQS